MASQTIYFDNPSTIASLQTQVQSMSGSVSQVQSLVGTTPTFNISKTTSNINQFLYGPNMPFQPSSNLPFLKVASGTGASQDAFGKTCLTWAGLVGNAFTGQEIFISTGACNANGDQWTQNVLTPLASSSKFFNSLLVLKALDDRLITLSDPIYYYLPEWKGTYYYYTTPATGVFGTSTTPPVWANFTGTIATGSMDTDFTIGQCISMNLGWPYPGAGEWPRGIQDGLTAPSVSTTPVDYAELNSIANFYQAVQKGISYAKAGSGPASAFADPNAMWDKHIARFSPNALTVGPGDTSVFMTGSNSDTLANALKLIKNGTVPLYYKPGSTTINTYTNIKQQKATYSELCYSLLGACLSKTVVAAGYASLVDYLNQKIMFPLDLTTNDYYVFNNTPIPTGAVCAEICGRRIDYMCSGSNWIGFSADPTQYQAGLDYASSSGATGYAFNSLYWGSRFPGDTCLSSQQSSSYNRYWSNDPYGFSLASNVVCNFKAWKKIIQLVINKGLYNGKQVISRAMINWGQNNVSAPGANFDQYGATQGLTSTNLRWCALQCFNFNGKDVIADVNQTEGSTTASIDYPGISSTAISILPSISNSCFYWAGSSGSMFILDIDTGFYSLVFDASTSGTNDAKARDAITPFTYISQSL